MRGSEITQTCLGAVSYRRHNGAEKYFDDDEGEEEQEEEQEETKTSVHKKPFVSQQISRRGECSVDCES